jgi:hypothetical protein
LLGLFTSPFFMNLNLFPIAVSQTHFMNFDNPTFRGWQDFTEFPNRAFAFHCFRCMPEVSQFCLYRFRLKTPWWQTNKSNPHHRKSKGLTF